MEVTGGDLSNDIGVTSPTNSTQNPPKKITVHICPTLGGQFDIELSKDETVEDLRRKISRHLQTPKERLKLLFKDNVLSSGSLVEQNIVDGCKLTLLPAVESGFCLNSVLFINAIHSLCAGVVAWFLCIYQRKSTVQGTQQSIIQAIESLSDPQIDDFLSGRLPLTLALRVGDHMMFVQLQLEQAPAQNTASSIDSKNHKSENHTPREGNSTPTLRHRGVTPVMGLPSRRMCHGSQINHFEHSTHHTLPQMSTTTPITRTSEESSGPAPKMAKMSPEQRSRPGMSNRNELCEAASTEMGILYNQHNHRHHASQAEFFNALNPVICDARANTFYQYPSHTLPTNNIGTNSSHLHKLVTAYTSLENANSPPPTSSKETKPRENRSSKAEKAKKRPSQPDQPSTSAIDYTQHHHPSLNSPSPTSVRNSYFPAAIIHDAIRRQAMGSANFMPTPVALLPSVYSELKAAEVARQQKHESNKKDSHSRQSHRDHGSTSSSRHSRHRKSNGKSGKIISSVGSISSHQASGMSGNRVVRQMQRLRRLCGSHQQCVAYSNRELASEISSIVHAAKHSHHQRSSEHRRSQKMCRECYHQNKETSQAGTSATTTTATTSTQNKPRTAQVSGACIDSFTTHGPGIFSGTFSGSLHPSVQDSEGKPRRDPQTILQILTDLLSAANIYQGQLGNIGLLPQLFKDQSGRNVKPESQTSSPRKTPKPNAANVKKSNATPRKSNSSSATSGPHNGPYILTPNVSETKGATLFKATSSVATVPATSQKLEEMRNTAKYASQQAINRYAMMSHLQQTSHYYRNQHVGKCHRHSLYQCKHKMVPGIAICCCCSSASRKQSKAQIRAKRLMQDNEVTRSKVKLLKDKMKERRAKRVQKRADVLTQGKKNINVESMDDTMATEHVARSTCNQMETITTVESSEVEMQLDSLANYAGKVEKERYGDDNNGEAAETVTV